MWSVTLPTPTNQKGGIPLQGYLHLWSLKALGNHGKITKLPCSLANQNEPI